MNRDELTVLPRHEMSPAARSSVREHVLRHRDDQAPSVPGYSAMVRRPTGTTASRRRWAAAVTAAAAGTAAVLAGTALFTGTSTSPAWAAEPDQLSGDGLRAARSDCEASLGAVPRRLAPQAVSAVVAERRGVTSSVLIAGPTTLGVCIGTAGVRLTGSVDLPSLAPGTALTVDGQPGVMNGPDPTRVVVGRVTGAASRVIVSTTDGRHVTASVQAGYYLAWWPSGADAVSVVATGANGSVIGQIAPAAVNPTGRPPAPQNTP